MLLFTIMGQFKGETGDHNLIFCLANISNSGIPFRRWLEMLARVLRCEGKHEEAGPAFCHANGFMISSSVLNMELYSVLSKLQMVRPERVGCDLTVTEMYNVFWFIQRWHNHKSW